MEENAKGASQLNETIKEQDLQEELARRINKIEDKIRQNVLRHIPHVPGEKIEVTGIEHVDYVPLETAIDYKAPSLRVSYVRTTQDKQGEIQRRKEQMIFSMDGQGNIQAEIAKIEQDGRIRITPEYREKLKNARSGAELVGENGEPYYVAKKGNKLQVREEKTLSPEEREREEIAQSYRRTWQEGEKHEGDDEILGITRIEDPRAIARVLDLPLERVSGKYKLVRFRGNKFILVDDKNQLVEGLSISELATDIQQKLNIGLQTADATIKGTALEAATTEDGKYDTLRIKKNGREEVQPEIMISYARTGNTEVQVFERDERGNLKPVEAEQTYAARIIEEDGQERKILPPDGPSLAELLEKQGKLRRALELQEIIEGQGNGREESSAEQEELDAILADLGIETVYDAQREAEETERYLGDRATERLHGRY